MKFWIDAQLSPVLAPWLSDTFGVQAFSLEWIGLQQANDRRIFSAAREANAVVITKDQDFVHLLNQLGPPPQVVWITCGNTSKVGQYFKSDTHFAPLGLWPWGEKRVL